MFCNYYFLTISSLSIDLHLTAWVQITMKLVSGMVALLALLVTYPSHWKVPTELLACPSRLIAATMQLCPSLELLVPWCHIKTSMNSDCSAQRAKSCWQKPRFLTEFKLLSLDNLPARLQRHPQAPPAPPLPRQLTLNPQK